jgi:pyridoxamine 5'-phosphate oxidase
MPVSDLSGERVDYVGDHLLESAVPAEPYALFRRWLDEAFAARDRGELAEPTAMVVATCVAGRPRARTVLLKELTTDGFTFFTNYTSAKGAELSADPAVALHFGWHAIQRQIRVEGTAEKVTRAESETYFATRPRGSQLGAWASAQSSTVGSLADLQDAYAAAERRFAGQDVPCPEHWGGYLVRPLEVEFWQGQPSRMHDRLVYRLSGAAWTVTRLAP